MMGEVLAAMAGAAIGLAGISAGSVIKRSNESRDAIVKLSVGIEQVSKELQAIRVEMKEDRHEIFQRLNSAEQRLSVLEVTDRQ